MSEELSPRSDELVGDERYLLPTKKFYKLLVSKTWQMFSRSLLLRYCVKLVFNKFNFRKVNNEKLPVF